jgi:hypothetical protein
MKDFEMTLENGESAKIYAYQGEEVPMETICVFLCQNKPNSFAIAVEVNGCEKHVVEISDRGHKITSENK